MSSQPRCLHSDCTAVGLLQGNLSPGEEHTEFIQRACSERHPVVKLNLILER